uniref:Galectin n=1 Tax=Ornithodoros moubata TaxID=6938 RepID=A1IHG1_ORNMO|nr:galectin [Ornithodoros moubata]BAF49629.1 galectin [Ornithodoros moubata]
MYRMPPFYPDPSLVTYSPLVPVRTPLRTLTPGTVIELHGRIHNTKRFAINLETKDGDIALHINPRFDCNHVVLNSFRGGKWEMEEHAPLTIAQGQDFSCMILVEKMEYKMAFNGQHLTSFKHRILFSLVDVLTVDPGVTVHKVDQKPPMDVSPPMQIAPSMPPGVAPAMLIGGGMPPQPTMQVMPSPAQEPTFNPPTPFCCQLAQGCYPGLLIYISGRPYAEPDRFNIDLTCGPHAVPGSPVAFHWNPRFYEKSVVRNSFLDEGWGVEEREGRGFPYEAGVHFDMIIQVLHDRINVAVNGQHYAEFRHRLQPISQITHLRIEGDVVIASVRFQ